MCLMTLVTVLLTFASCSSDGADDTAATDTQTAANVGTLPPVTEDSTDTDTDESMPVTSDGTSAETETETETETVPVTESDTTSPNTTVDTETEKAPETEKKDDPPAETEKCFANSYAKVGEELVCKGYPNGVKYNWTILNMRGEPKKRFTNSTGKYTPTKDDVESLITVSVDGYDDISIYCSELPILYIESDVAYSSVNKTSYSDVYFKLTGNSKYKTGLYDGNAKLRLRGNSTSGLDKRPFKVKLSDKANLLGISDGESKHWVLLANAVDHTLMRNKLLFDFSGAIGTEYYTKSENVVLIYNGEYYGVYQLCEHVRISDARIDIYDWDKTAEKLAKAVANRLLSSGSIKKSAYDDVKDEIEDMLTTDWSWIDSGSFKYKGKSYKASSLGITLPKTTGGYLIEMDFYSQNNSSLARIESAYKQPLYFSGPGIEDATAAASFRSTSLYKNAYKYMQSFEYALHSDDFVFRSDDTHYEATGKMGWWTDEWGNPEYTYTYNISDYTDAEHEGWHYSDFFNMDSLVNNFIFCEFAMNWDSMKNSFFYYKGINGKAKIGPQWDFDWAWGNKNMYNIDTYYPESWHTTNDYFAHEQYYQSVQWNRMLIRDPYFLALAYEKYHEIRPTVIENLIKNGGTIDTYMKTLRTAALANDYRWKYSYGSYGGEEFDNACKSMKAFIKKRVSWLDKQFSSMDTLVNSLGYYVISSRVKVDSVTVGDKVTTVVASVTDPEIAKLTFQLNGTNFVTVDVVAGKATATFGSSLVSSEHVNCVQVKARTSDGEYYVKADGTVVGVHNNVRSNYIVFEK